VNSAPPRPRPLIGVTTYPRAGERRLAFSLPAAYVDAVRAGGGVPILLPPGEERPEDLLDGLHGVLFGGGGDLDPDLFGGPRHASVYGVDRERDAFELALVREGLARDRPTLAICRGQQVLNVATGGTLIQDIASSVAGADDHDPERERWELSHEVRLLPGSRLRQVLGEDSVAVNSFHHQAVKDLGQGLVASAWSVADGVIEGIESPTHRFVLGVQWHPESFWDRPPGFQPLFQALVAAAREKMR